MNKKKIVVFGCQQIAVDFINFLLTLRDVDVSLIVTYELPLDKTYGYKSVIEEFTKKGMNVKMPSSINAAIIREIENIRPDAIFSVYYRKIFPAKVLELPKVGCINIHPALLPFYRGPVPTAWAIMNGEKYFGITIHYMDAGVDTGDILVQKKYGISEEETGYELYTRAMRSGARLLMDNFHKIMEKQIVPRRQKGTGSYYGKMHWRHIIDWKKKAEDIRNMIRVHARPYNTAEALLLNRYVLINKTTVVNGGKYVLQGPGKIVDILKDKRLVVSCADGFLRLEEYDIFPKLSVMEEEIYLKKGNSFD